MSFGTLVLVPILVCGFLSVNADSPLQVAVAIGLCFLFLMLVIPIQIYLSIKGTRTLTLFHDSMTVEHHGQASELHRLDKVTSIRRWKNSRSSSQSFDAFYFFKLTFDTGKSIKFATNEALPFLLESVSRRLRTGLIETLAKGGSVKWGPDVVIQQEGLTMPVSGLLTRKRLVTWDKFRAIKFVDHHAHIFLHEKKGVATKIECGHPEFFPCLELVREMVRRNASAKLQPCTVEAVACC